MMMMLQQDNYLAVNAATSEETVDSFLQFEDEKATQRCSGVGDTFTVPCQRTGSNLEKIRVETPLHFGVEALGVAKG